MTPAGFAQDVEPATPAEAGEAEPAADQEVEINEDNYRQFMELKDAMRQRTVLPENAYQSQAGLQKLDKLPESSQKHLRNQLREVIVEGEAWQPGDEDRSTVTTHAKPTFMPMPAVQGQLQLPVHSGPATQVSRENRKRVKGPVAMRMKVVEKWGSRPDNSKLVKPAGKVAIHRAPRETPVIRANRAQRVFPRMPWSF
jgi:hypothetical protein